MPFPVKVGAINETIPPILQVQNLEATMLWRILEKEVCSILLQKFG
jgi:hypothetical protein